MSYQVPLRYVPNGRFGKYSSAKKIRDVSAHFHAETSRIILVCFWFFTNWLGPVCRIQVCRILELKKNDKTIDVGMMQNKTCLVYVPISSSALRPLGATYIIIIIKASQNVLQGLLPKKSRASDDSLYRYR